MTTTQQATGQQGKGLTLKQAMDLALQWQSQGLLDKAQHLLRATIAAHPAFAPALHLLGVVEHQRGNTEQALGLIAQAIEIDGQALFYSNYAEMSRLLGRIDVAITFAEKAVALSPELAGAHSNLGVAYFDNGQFDKAEQCQLKALSLSPKLAPALNNLASIYRERKDKNAAIEQYRKVLQVQPQYVEAMSNLGATLSECDRHEEALPYLLQAIKLKPNYAEAHCNIGATFFGLEQYEKSVLAYQNALKLKPDYPEAYIGLAKNHQEKNRMDDAEQMARKAIQCDESSAESYSVLGAILMETGFANQAEEAFQQALLLKPEHLSALSGLATLMMEEGRLLEAEDAFKQVLALEADSIVALASLAQVRKATKDDTYIAEMEAFLQSNPNASRKKAMTVHFALGKCYDDLKDADKAFAHFAKGCAMKRATFEYTAAGQHQLIQQIKSVFNADFIRQFEGAGCETNVPVFVLGMPRSGTTLTEQIIASHPEVYGAGELSDITRLSYLPRANDQSVYPYNIAGFTAENFKQFGEQYLANIRKHNTELAHITDKMPANFLYLGLIHLALPNAKIVHVKRNPVDTSLSCFTKIFNRGQYFSYDLKELGEFYCDYVELMAHWKAVLPANSFYEVQYEELVADNENQARKLIEYCGLPWNDACLESHKTERNIRTASVTQVRQPIYKSSVERWRAYEQHLQPLLQVLGDLVPVAGKQ